MRMVLPQGILQLKEIRKEDLENIRILRNNYREYFINKELISSEQQIEWFKSYLKAKDIMFSVFIDEDWIGCAALCDKQDDNSYVEFGRFMLNNKSHKGLGKYVVSLVCQYAFEQLNVHSIVLEVFSDNLKAICVYKKVGFKESTIKPMLDKEIIVMKLERDDIVRFG